jgi:hypothetical protein
MLYKLAGAETRKIARQDWHFAMTSSSANLVWFLHLEKPKNPKTERKKKQKSFQFFLDLYVRAFSSHPPLSVCLYTRQSALGHQWRLPGDYLLAPLFCWS